MLSYFQVPVPYLITEAMIFTISSPNLYFFQRQLHLLHISTFASLLVFSNSCLFALWIHLPKYPFFLLPTFFFFLLFRWRSVLVCFTTDSHWCFSCPFISYQNTHFAMFYFLIPSSLDEDHCLFVSLQVLSNAFEALWLLTKTTHFLCHSNFFILPLNCNFHFPPFVSHSNPLETLQSFFSWTWILVCFAYDFR